MLTKNIIFKNFLGKNSKKKKIILNKFFSNQNLIKEYPLLSSLKENYSYSYKKKDIDNLKKFSSLNLIGMGGSVLGSQAIYDYLNHKVKKKFTFYNNIQSRKISKKLPTKENRPKLIR